MEVLLGAGMIFMLGVDLVVGVRLLLLARRTRALPELAFGSAFVLLGAVGYPLATAARRIAVDAPGLGGSLLLAALAAQNLACGAIYLANVRVFRPAAAGARIGSALAWSALVLSWGGQAWTGQADGGVAYTIGLTARGGAFVWGAVESLGYYRRLRRRLALGLADPLVTDRFRLWGIANAAIAAAFLVFLAGRVVTAGGPQPPLVMLLTSAVGVVAGATIWLAFVPPAAYARRVRASFQAR